MSTVRRLFVILGDQLDRERFLPTDFDPSTDSFWMAEAVEESTHVLSNKHRIVQFLSAMRHFQEYIRQRDLPIIYRKLDRLNQPSSLGDNLRLDIEDLQVKAVSVVKPGDFRLESDLRKVCLETGVELLVREDEHFLSSIEEFQEFAKGRKELRLEHFYRYMRKKHGILMDDEKSPTGGKWNFDHSNRQSFGKNGPDVIELERGTAPDAITKEVIEMVNREFPSHSGNLDYFRWPVTTEDAEVELANFLQYGLPWFGKYQDAMWTGRYTLFHSLLAPALNLKILDARKTILAVEREYLEGRASIESVEGFIRQVLGWREYVRGLYFKWMPGYRDQNFLNANNPLPDSFWTGKTEMNCLSQCVTQVLDTGYGHHIQRLMVIGLYALLRGTIPSEINDWFLANYADAVDWVTTPNVIGMCQYADGGIMASKPYVASGAYISRMSNYCEGCRYNPKESTGPNACPFTTLYWNFLIQHESILKGNQRMFMQLRNLSRLSETQKVEVQQQAGKVLEKE
jgi:deoxyribodipyrimidine photolyase-related protein